MIHLTPEERSLIERADSAVAGYRDELAGQVPDMVESLRIQVDKGHWQGARRDAVDLRELAGTTGWTPLAEAAKHLILLLDSAPSEKLPLLATPILHGILKIGRASDRTITPELRALLRQMADVSKFYAAS